MKKGILLLMSICFAQQMSAQSLGVFTPKEDVSGGKKLQSKEIYIADFRVHYQIFNEKESTTSGGIMGGALKGNTKAELAVGLKDLSPKDLQEITNEIYNNFITDLGAKGFSIVSSENAGSTNAYKGFEKISNLEPSLSEAPGVVSVYPQNATFYVEGFTNSGKKKDGGTFGAIARVSNSNQDYNPDINGLYPKLSSELNNATVADVDLYVLFVNDQKSYEGKGAKITISTALRLSANDVFEAKNNSKSLVRTKEVIYTKCNSEITFVQGKFKVGGSPESVYTGTLKKNLDINEIIGKEKLSSFARANYDFSGDDTAFGTLYSVENEVSDELALIDLDVAKYKKGVKEAATKFLTYHVEKFNAEF